MSTITIRFLTGKVATATYNPDELVWQFSKRVGEELGLLIDGGITNRYAFRQADQPIINNYENRLKRVSDLISDSTQPFFAIDTTMTPSCGRQHYMGNASPNGTERVICAICLENLEVITSGTLDNPVRTLALDCAHLFHRGCIKNWFKAKSCCPICNEVVALSRKQYFFKRD